MKTIFLLGLNQSHDSFDKTIQNMKEINPSDCIVVDYHQFQHSIKSYPQLACAIEQYLLEVSSKEPINIVGLSLGSVIALHFAINHTDRISSMVLIACQHKMPRFLLNVQNSFMSCIPNTFFKDSVFSKEEIIMLVHSMCGINYENALGNVRCRTLLVCGSNDWINLKESKKLCYLIEHSKLKVIKNANHEVNIDQPVELGNVINQFIKE